MAWDEWFQDVAKDAIGKYVDKETMPRQSTFNMGALGQQGYYQEGQPGVYGSAQSGIGGMSTGVILAGVGVLAVVALLVLKD